MRSLVAIALALATSILPAAAHAADDSASEPAPRRLSFSEDFRPVSAIDVALSATLLGTWMGLQFGTSLAEEPRWRDVPGFDRSARESLVASSRAGRNSAALWSEVLWLGPMAWAIVDGAVVPLASDRGNIDIAWQLTVMNAEALATAGLFARGGHLGFARERPDARPCREDDTYSGPCGGGNTASFPSGHAAGAMAGAGLVCAHHVELPLYGGLAPDVGACAVATSFAVTGSVLRLVADRHYATDVIAGGTFGFASGLGLPMLLHYHAPWFEGGEASSRRAQVVASAPDADAGVSIVGMW